MSLGRQRVLIILCCAIVAGLPLLVFQNVLGFEFLNYDDDIYITGNPVIQSLHVRHLWAMFSQGYFRSYQPLTLLSHALDYAVWGADPWGHHLTNLLLHAANSVMLMGLGFLILRRREPGDHSEPGGYSWWVPMLAAATAAILFAIHPLRVESVAWLSDRKDLLMTFFLIPSCAAYFRSRTEERDRESTRWYWASVVLFGCAVLAKTVAVMLPLALFSIDLLLLRRHHRKPKFWELVRLKAPFAFVSLALGMVAVAVASGHTVSRFVRDLSLLEKVLVPAYSLGIYLIRTVWPLGLTPVYTAPTLPVLAGVAAAVVFLSAGLIRLRGKSVAEYSLLAGWVFALFVLPTMVGIVAKTGIQPWADRYVYFASAPLFLLLGGGMNAFLGHRTRSQGRLGLGLTAGLAASALFLSAIIARQYLPVWGTSEGLWRSVIEASPELSYGYNNLGAVLMSRGESSDALTCYRTAQDRDPGAPGPWYNMGLAYANLGDADSASWYYRQALARDSTYVDAYTALGTLALSAGDPAEACREYEAALRYDPFCAKAHHNIGIIHYQRGERTEAARCFERAVASEPFSTRALLSLGVVYNETGQEAKARGLFRDAARLGSREAQQLLAAEKEAW